MTIENLEIFPATAFDVDDPNKLGRIKVEAPTIFDTSIMTPEGLPWVYPCAMPGYQRFSKLMKGSKVWLMHDKRNWREWWYWPMFEMYEDTRKLIEDYDDAEVLLSRNMGTSSVYIYYNNTDGIKMQVGEKTYVNITPDNAIRIQAEKAVIDLKEDKVIIGHDGEHEPAVLGNKLVAMISQLKQDLENLSTIAANATPCTPLAAGFTTAATNLGVKGNEGIILCKNTEVN